MSRPDSIDLLDYTAAGTIVWYSVNRPAYERAELSTAGVTLIVPSRLDAMPLLTKTRADGGIKTLFIFPIHR